MSWGVTACLPRCSRRATAGVSRLVLDTLRDAQGAISEEKLVETLVQTKGLAAQPDAVPGVRKTLLAVLRHLATQGVARSVALEDGARAWRRN